MTIPFHPELPPALKELQAQHGDDFSLAQKQTGLAFDLISEGPIEGLVNEAEGVFLNGVPLRDKDTNLALKEIITTGTIAGDALTTLTVPDIVMDDMDSDSVTDRTVQILGAGKALGGVTFTIQANSNRLVASGSFFTPGMAGFDSGSPDVQLGWENQIPVEIPGAGSNDGSLFATITNYDSATVVYLDTKALVGISGGDDLKFGHKSKISSVNKSTNTITLATAATAAVTDESVIINPPIISNVDGTKGRWNFTNVSYAFRTGTENQNPIPMKGDVATNASYLHAPGITLKQASAHTGTASDSIISSDTMGIANAPEIDRIKLTFDMPSGMRIIDESNGDEHTTYFELEIFFEYSNDDGTSFNRVKLAGRPSYNPVNLYKQGASGPGSGFTVPANANGGIITGKFDKRKLKEMTFSIEEYQPFTDWRVRVRKVSADEIPTGDLPEKFKHQGVIAWQTIEALVEDSLMYPLSAYGAVTFGAEDFTQPPKRHYHIKGLKIQVPTNYITREEAGSLQAKYTRNVSNGTDENKEQDWNGGFRGDLSNFSAGSANGKLVYCNNPAWVFYDLCVNQRYGLGKIVDPSLVDKYALYSIARYCDELVPDGKGGQEPRFTCNAYITRQTEAYKVLKDLATVFRGLAYWMDGQVVAVQDGPKEPIYTFTQGNVIDGKFAYESTSDRIQKNQVRVTWNDPDSNFTQRVELVEDHDDIVEKNRFVPHDVSAFGCTSKGQARRIGLWHLITGRQETELVKFKTGEAGYFIKPGDIIFVQDHQRNAIEFSGRISLESPVATTTSFALDRPITLSASADYEVFVFFSNAVALLNQDAATINSTSYSRGDVVTTGITAGSPGGTVTIDSEEIASSIIDDSGDIVTLQWAGEGHLEKRDISNSGTVSHITVSSAFSSAPSEDFIFAIRNKAGGTEEPKQYRVLGVAEDDDEHVEVIASFFFDRKFDAIDHGYAVSLSRAEEPSIRREGQIPKPTDVSLMYGQASFNYGLRDNSTEGRNKETTVNRTTRAVLSWGEPEEIVPSETVYKQVGSPAVEAVTHLSTTLSDLDKIMYVNDASYFSTDGGYVRIGSGDNREWIKFTGIDLGSPNALTGLTRGVNNTIAKTFESSRSPSVIQYETVARRYNKLAGYDVEIHGGPYETPIKTSLNSDETSYILPGQINPSIYTAKIRTRNTKGNVSDFIIVTRSLELSVTDASDRLHQLPRGGYCSTTMKIDTTSGLLTFHHPDFVFQSVNNNIYEYENVAELSETIDFGGLVGGTTAFLAHHPQDESPEKFTNDFIPVEEQQHSGFKFSDAEVSPEITSNAVWLKQVGQSGSPDTFGLTQASGTITTVRGSSEVTGSSTAFTTDFSVGDLIRFDTSSTIALNSTAFYARVANIVNDTTIILEKSIDRLFSGDFVFKQTFKPDFVEDSLVTRVIKDSADKFTLLPFSGTIVGPNAVQSAEIAANAVGSGSIATGIIDATILADGSIDGDLIADGAIINVHISANAIETANIAANSIENAQISANSIEAASISANSINAAKIEAGSIGNVAIAANAINEANISAGSINSIMMGANAIESVNISSGAVGTVNIAANAIESANISAGAIDTVNIAANAITFSEIEAGTIQAVNIAANAIGIQEIAAGSIDSVKIAANAIGQANIQADAIGSVELSTNAVINANIASDSIESVNMSAGSVINAAIAANSIENQNITAQAVNAVIIAPNALENFHVSVNAITGSNIAENSIEQALIAANAIGTAQILANSIGAAAIAAGSIGVASMAANAIGTAQIIAGSIDTTEIAADAITNAKIDGGAIEAAAISANAITAAAIQAGSVTNAKIGANAIANAQIRADSISTAEIQSNSISTAKIQGLSITSAQIAANQITSAKIAANSITTAKIVANSITNAEVVSGSIEALSVAANSIGSAEIKANNITSVEIAANVVRTTLSSEISSVTIDGDGLIYSGSKSTYGSTAAGWILDASTGTGRINIGSSTNYVQFDGTTLSVAGSLNVGGTTLTTTNTLNANTTAANVGLGNVDNNSTSDIRAVGAATSGTVGGWTIDSSAIFSGTKDTSGFTSTNGHITITSAGGIHTPKFFVDSSGNAGFSGTVSVGGTDLTTTNTLNANTTAANVGLGNVDNNSTSDIRAVGAATSGTVGGWTINSTTITSGNITLDNSNNRILITD